jgi:peptidyl-prolyl cis-trans isomerase D
LATSTITTQDYARAVQQEIAAMSQQLGVQIGMNEATAFGLDRQALSNVVTRAALDAEANASGLSVGDASVAAEVMKMDAFKGTSGAFDRETYAFALRQQRLERGRFRNRTAPRRVARRSCRAPWRAGSRRRSRWSTRFTAGSANAAACR